MSHYAGVLAARSPWPRTFYYGWVTLTVSALAMVGTLPGRTQGLGLITEPLIRDVGIDRVAFAQINLVATLIGSLFCFGIGRLMDRHGSRVVLTGVSIALGVSVLLMSRAAGLWTLAACLLLTRGLGQSALSVVSLAAVGKWFSRRLPAAMAVYTLVMSVGFMAAFPLIGAVTSARGWRVSWTIVGLALVAGLAPLSWLLVRSTPEACGLRLDGDAAVDEERLDSHSQPADDDATLAGAVRTPAFWVFGLASAAYGLVASGIALFNESILAERGFEAAVYHRSLAFTALAALAGNFAAGALAARASLRRLLVIAMVLLGGGLAALPHVSTEPHVVAWAIAMGVAGGFVMVVFFSFWGRAYGRAHLGRIQGAAQALTVLASAIGPLLLAWCVSSTGSYAIAFYTLSIVVLILTVAAAVVRIPVRLASGASPLQEPR